MQRTIHRGRDPAWPGIDRIAIELHAAALRRTYAREALASVGRAIARLAGNRR